MKTTKDELIARLMERCMESRNKSQGDQHFLALVDVGDVPEESVSRSHIANLLYDGYSNLSQGIRTNTISEGDVLTSDDYYKRVTHAVCDVFIEDVEFELETRHLVSNRLHMYYGPNLETVKSSMRDGLDIAGLYAIYQRWNPNEPSVTALRVTPLQDELRHYLAHPNH